MAPITPQRPAMPASLGSAPGKLFSSNGHSNVPSRNFTNGIQVVDSDGTFGEDLGPYLQHEHVIPAGFNYHLISVFGSQSTGKSTLLNALFGTDFNVMDEEERQQTTKGIWLAKNKTAGDMAENILVMDVEGTDGQERGEDQDFERKSALFALATSEVLLVNMWENQVGLYHGANMGLLKTVFEVNLQLFVKDAKTVPRSLLLFVIRDFQGRTPLANLRKTLLGNLDRIWSSISKPAGLEESRIEDYFDFAFAGLPNKYDKAELFKKEVTKLAERFQIGYKDPKKVGLVDEDSQPLLVPEYHRRIPADGFSIYAKGVWEQIQSNKDLDLPTQQELLAQFRCLEISRECLVAFDAIITPLETEQADASRDGRPLIIRELGKTISTARTQLMDDFEAAASRYHTKVYQRQGEELETTVDARLKILFDGQLSSTHKLGVIAFKNSVSKIVQDGAKSGAQYDFAQIVAEEKQKAVGQFNDIAKASSVPGTSFSNYDSQLRLFQKELDSESAQLRQNEMRLLATRIERWIKSQFDESIGLEFSKLGSKQPTTNTTTDAKAQSLTPTEAEHWDRVWSVFTKTVTEASSRFTTRAAALTASDDEVSVGLWRLRRKAWATLKAKLAEELADGNLLSKLRETFEDRFRYDSEGVPRVWTANDDIKGAYERARDASLALIPLLSVFRLSSSTHDDNFPPLVTFIGTRPEATTAADEADLAPVGGIDDPDATLANELTLVPNLRQQELTTRFRRNADALYVDTERSLSNPLTHTPWYVWGAMVFLGWNEAWAVVRSPWLFTLAILAVAAAGAVWYLGMERAVGRMARAAAVEVKAVVGEWWEAMLDARVNAREGHQQKRAVAWEASGSGSNSKTQTTNAAAAAAARPKVEEIKLSELSGEGKAVHRDTEESSIWDD